jgi:MFS family permease
MATSMLGMVYSQSGDNGILPDNDNIIIKSVTTAGTVFGQIVFGYLADVVGRKKMYGVELVIVISTTLAQALCSSSMALNVVSVISFWRFMMGIGVGGGYSLSAVITSEMADTKWRGAMISAVFAMQGFGQFFAAAISLIVTFSFKGILQPVESTGDCTGECQRTMDMMWRIVIGFGAVPGWFALYYRLTIPETPRYTFDVKHDLEKATADSRRLRIGNIWSEQAKAKLEMRKYIGQANAIKQIITATQFLLELRLPIIHTPIKLYADNTSSQALAHRPSARPQSGHIDAAMHFQREKVETGLVDTTHVASQDNAADGFTKPLNGVKFARFRELLRIH